MSKTNDGGPAFPSHGSMGEVAHEGMTLRDYFAAKAMAAIILKAPYEVRRADEQVEKLKYISVGAYLYADAMLKARESK